MDLVGAIAPLPAERARIASKEAKRSALDLMAAEVITRSADQGNEAADHFIAEARESLGLAAIHGARAKRLRSKAGTASVMGYHRLAMLGAEAADEEDLQKDRYLAKVSRGVRDSHMGSAFDMRDYQTAHELKAQERERYVSNLSSAQRENLFQKLQDEILHSSANYGEDEEGFGGEDDLAEEHSDGGAMDELAAACRIYGGDMESVFGVDCYGGLLDIFRPSADRLKKRKARVESRLEKATEKMEELEDAGKTGLKFQYWRGRIKRLETRLEKLNEKLRKLGALVEETKEAKDKADDLADAELGAVVDPDWDAEHVGVDAVLLKEADVFGMTQRRANRIRRRIQRLRRRLERLQESGKYERRQDRMEARIERLVEKLEEEGLSEAPSLADDSLDKGDSEEGMIPGGDPEEAVSSITSPGGIASDEDFISSFSGVDAMPGNSDERRVFVGFFHRQAANRGGLNVQMDGFGAEEQEGFFARIGNWFQNLFTTTSDKARKQAKIKKAGLDAKRKARAKEGVVAKRRDLRDSRQARQRSASRAARDAWNKKWEQMSPAVGTKKSKLKRARQAAQAEAKRARQEERARLSNPGTAPMEASTEAASGAMHFLRGDNTYLYYFPPAPHRPNTPITIMKKTPAGLEGAGPQRTLKTLPNLGSFRGGRFVASPDLGVIGVDIPTVAAWMSRGSGRRS